MWHLVQVTLQKNAENPAEMLCRCCFIVPEIYTNDICNDRLNEGIVTLLKKVYNIV